MDRVGQEVGGGECDFGFENIIWVAYQKCIFHTPLFSALFNPLIKGNCKLSAIATRRPGEKMVNSLG